MLKELVVLLGSFQQSIDALQKDNEKALLVIPFYLHMLNQTDSMINPDFIMVQHHRKTAAALTKSLEERWGSELDDTYFILGGYS